MWSTSFDYPAASAAGRDARGGGAVGEGRHARLPGAGARADGRQLGLERPRWVGKRGIDRAPCRLSGLSPLRARQSRQSIRAGGSIPPPSMPQFGTGAPVIGSARAVPGALGPRPTRSRSASATRTLTYRAAARRGDRVAEQVDGRRARRGVGGERARDRRRASSARCWPASRSRRSTRRPATQRARAHPRPTRDPELVLCPPGVELPAALPSAARRRRPRRARAATSRTSPATRRRRSSSTRRARPARRRAPCCRGARSPPTSTRWPRRGSGPATTSSPTALPLFHVHGLILGMLGPVRRGGGVHHLGRFSAEGAAAALAGRRDDAVRASRRCTTGSPPTPSRTPTICRALGRARLLVSGSAALPAIEHERIERLTGQRIVERYGMTETLMNTGVRASTASAGPATSARRWTDVELRLRRRRRRPDRRGRRRDDRRDPGARARTSSSSTSTAPTRPPRR